MVLGTAYRAFKFADLKTWPAVDKVPCICRNTHVTWTHFVNVACPLQSRFATPRPVPTVEYFMCLQGPEYRYIHISVISRDYAEANFMACIW